jgi:hypothetical protein
MIGQNYFYHLTSGMADKLPRPIIVNETVEARDAWIRNLHERFLAIIQLLLDPEEFRPLPRSRVGLSTEEREARRAYELLKEDKMKEIHEFRQNYKGPLFRPVERFNWGPMCMSWECPMRLEAFNHEAGEDCLLDPKEVWNLQPAMILLKPVAAKAYMDAEAALAKAKEEDAERTLKEDWICADQQCPNLYCHARGEACKLTMEELLPLTSKPPISEAAAIIAKAVAAGWRDSGMKPYTGLYCH